MSTQATSGHQPLSVRLQTFAENISAKKGTVTDRSVVGQLNKKERELLQLALKLLQKENYTDASVHKKYAELGGDEALARIEGVLSGTQPRVQEAKISFIAAQRLQTPKLAQTLRETLEHLAAKHEENPFALGETAKGQTGKKLNPYFREDYAFQKAMIEEGQKLLLERATAGEARPGEDSLAPGVSGENPREALIRWAKEAEQDTETYGPRRAEGWIEAFAVSAVLDSKRSNPLEEVEKVYEEALRNETGTALTHQAAQTALVLDAVKKEERQAEKEINALKGMKGVQAKPIIGEMVLHYNRLADNYRRLAELEENVSIRPLLEARAQNVEAFAHDLGRLPTDNDASFTKEVTRLQRSFEGLGKALQNESKEVKAFLKGVTTNPDLEFPTITLGQVEGPKAASPAKTTPKGEVEVPIGELRDHLAAIVNMLDGNNVMAKSRLHQLFKSDATKLAVIKGLEALKDGVPAHFTKEEATSWFSLTNVNVGGRPSIVDRIKLFFAERANKPVVEGLRYFQALSSIKSGIRALENHLAKTEPGSDESKRTIETLRIAKGIASQQVGYKSGIRELENLLAKTEPGSDESKRTIETLRIAKGLASQQMGYYDGIQGYETGRKPNASRIETLKSRAEAKREITVNRITRNEMAHELGTVSEAESVLRDLRNDVDHFITQLERATSLDAIQRLTEKELQSIAQKEGDEVGFYRDALERIRDHLNEDSLSDLAPLVVGLTQSMGTYRDSLTRLIDVVKSRETDPNGAVKSAWVEQERVVTDREDALVAQQKFLTQLDIEIGLYKETIRDLKKNKSVVPSQFVAMRSAILGGTDKGSGLPHHFADAEQKAREIIENPSTSPELKRVYEARLAELEQTKEALERSATIGEATRVPFVNQLGSILEKKIAAREALVKATDENLKAYRTDAKELSVRTKALEEALHPKEKGIPLFNRLFGGGRPVRQREEGTALSAFALRESGGGAPLTPQALIMEAAGLIGQLDAKARSFRVQPEEQQKFKELSVRLSDLRSRFEKSPENVELRGEFESLIAEAQTKLKAKARVVETESSSGPTTVAQAPMTEEQTKIRDLKIALSIARELNEQLLHMPEQDNMDAYDAAAARIEAEIPGLKNGDGDKFLREYIRLPERDDEAHKQKCYQANLNDLQKLDADIKEMERKSRS